MNKLDAGEESREYYVGAGLSVTFKNCTEHKMEVVDVDRTLLGCKVWYYIDKPNNQDTKEQTNDR